MPGSDDRAAAPEGRRWLRVGAVGPVLAFLAAMTGPGALVSNAVAGASYGYDLLWALAVALVFRYVWVDTSARYVLVSGESLLQGYARIGRWLVWTVLAAALLVRHSTDLYTILLMGNVVQHLLPLRDNGVADIAQTVQELSPVALEAVERTMYNARSERLRFDAASTILDRAGYSSINKTKIDLTTASTTPYSSMLEDELRQMLLNRVEGIKSMNAEKERQTAESEAMQLEFRGG